METLTQIQNQPQTQQTITNRLTQEILKKPLQSQFNSNSNSSFLRKQNKSQLIKDKSNSHLVAIKRKWNSKVEVIKENVTLFEGTDLANLLFKFCSIKSASVIYVDPAGSNLRERFNSVYKISSICNHESIQELFNFDLGHSLPTCELCKCVILNNPEFITESLLNNLKESRKGKNGKLNKIEA